MKRGGGKREENEYEKMERKDRSSASISSSLKVKPGVKQRKHGLNGQVSHVAACLPTGSNLAQKGLDPGEPNAISTSTFSTFQLFYLILDTCYPTLLILL
jgi:hypothetical protein